ncbi:hypothetical protein [Mycobacterium sp.]|uniref:hypothetical protein n=1 Tax=Mycobacterium sp. TaxID=1785 RepID=UPI002CD696FF|nr:hypothetical protein [Mycobacterium sp.]HKP42058.1 hypothetical protein [Mycobacterium sp.]
MDWDDEVDVVCSGSGVAGLARAISAVDMGGEVFVASPHGAARPGPSPLATRSRVDSLIPWLDVEVWDAETNEYFAALSADVGPLRRSTSDVDVPIRSAHQLEPVDPRGTVPPFVGARLRDWTARCLASPSGYLYTRVSDWPSETFRAPDGDTIEVVEIGSMTPDPDDVGGSVVDWLTAQARDRQIEAQPNCELQRILFEEGEVVGAVFSTPDGPLAIRAWHGVHIAADSLQKDVSARQEFAVGTVPLRICLVGRTGSRFGRVELLTSEPLAHGAPTCRPNNRALQAGLGETHTYLQTWRSRKLNGDPPLGQ